MMNCRESGRAQYPTGRSALGSDSERAIESDDRSLQYLAANGVEAVGATDGSLISSLVS
jgi:hypothetical protein